MSMSTNGPEKPGLDLLVGALMTALTAPRESFARILALRPGAEARWLAVAIVSILPVAILMLATLGLPDAALDPVTTMMRHPVAGVFLQVTTLVIMSAAIAAIGQRFGGHARFADAMVVMVWIQFVMACIQVVLVVLMLVSEPVAVVLSLGAIAVYLRLLTHGTAIVNGFTNLPLVLLGIAVTAVLFVTVVGVALAVLGIMPEVASGAGHV